MYDNVQTQIKPSVKLFQVVFRLATFFNPTAAGISTSYYHHVVGNTACDSLNLI